MSLTYETLNILFLLVPGFISICALDIVVTRRDVGYPAKIIEALIFSLLIYSTINMVYKWEPLVTPVISDGLTGYIFSADIKLILLTLTVSVLLPILFGAVIHNDLHTKFLRMIKVTDKTSRSSVWQDVFINEKRHLVVSLRDGRRIYGWPMYYAHNNSESHMYLFQPAWVTDDGSYIECNTHGILISYEDIELIEFMKKQEENLASSI